MSIPWISLRARVSIFGLVVLCAALQTTSALQAQAPPLPFGWAVTPDEKLLFRTDEHVGSVVVRDIDPTSPTFTRVVGRIILGGRPAGIAAAPSSAGPGQVEHDVLVANTLLDELTVIDAATLTVRKTIRSPWLDGAWDVAMGPRETVGAPGFQSGTYHAYVTARPGVAVFESGPAGVPGIGFDDLIGLLPPPTGGELAIVDPRGAWFTLAPIDAFADSIGAWVAHGSEAGHGAASLALYSKDGSPGQEFFNTTAMTPNFGAKVFEVVRQFVSTHHGTGLDVALADEDLSVSNPTRLYLSMTGGVVDVFDLESGAFLQRVHTAFDITDLGPYLKP